MCISARIYSFMPGKRALLSLGAQEWKKEKKEPAKRKGLPTLRGDHREWKIGEGGRPTSSPPFFPPFLGKQDHLLCLSCLKEEEEEKPFAQKKKKKLSGRKFLLSLPSIPLPLSPSFHSLYPEEKYESRASLLSSSLHSFLCPFFAFCPLPPFAFHPPSSRS